MTSKQCLLPDPTCTAAIFDGLSSIYDNARNREFYTRSAEFMLGRAAELRRIGVDARCLDLACGTGISTQAALAMLPEAQWFGLDGSAEMLRIARAKQALEPVRFVHSSAERTPFPNHSFHWIFCNIAYHWLHPNALDEMKRLLKPQGRLSLMVPLVYPSGNASGNRWLGSILMRFSRWIVPRRSQGLTLAALQCELKDFHLDHAQILDFDENYTSVRELLDVLESRSSLSAIFGERAEEVRTQLYCEDLSAVRLLRFRWKMGFVEAQIR